MTSLIPPGRAHSQAQAWSPLLKRIQRNIAAAVRSIHDNQPGYPSQSDSRGGKGGHSDPTSNLAFADDPAREAGEEVTALVGRITTDLQRLEKLASNWSGPSDRYREVLATDAAAKLDDEGSWCQAHQRAGSLERTRRDNGRLCRWCEDVRRDIGGDPPVWLVEKRAQGRKITEADVARAKRERKGKR